MTTADLHAMLQQHEAAEQKEAADLQRMREYAVSLARPFSRDQGEAHFTASAIVVSADGLSTCVVHHRQLGRWLQPGGHFEEWDGGDVRRAALREVLEETGCAAVLIAAAPLPLDVDIHEIPAHGHVSAHLHLDLRILVSTSDSAIRHDPDESLGVKWVGWAEAIGLADDPSLRRALRKGQRWVQRTALPLFRS
jgi:8-oxo-dGTP pyrophosphatase MutT (NUDIX family)